LRSRKKIKAKNLRDKSSLHFFASAASNVFAAGLLFSAFRPIAGAEVARDIHLPPFFCKLDELSEVVADFRLRLFGEFNIFLNEKRVGGPNQSISMWPVS